MRRPHAKRPCFKVTSAGELLCWVFAADAAEAERKARDFLRREGRPVPALMTVEPGEPA